MIALQAAISGLSTLQHMLDVVGGNLSNSNTPGYKASEMTFKETFGEVLQGASAPAGNLGSVNPKQMGTGVAIGALVQDYSQGGLDVTGRPSDLALNGHGFFVLRELTGGLGYTRAGNFSVDRNGFVTNPDGLKVQGWNAVNGVMDERAPVSALQVPMGKATIARATANVGMGGNLDASMAVFAAGPPPSGGQFTSEAQVYDSLGDEHSVSVTFTRVAPTGAEGGRWSWTATTDGGTAAGSGTLVFAPDGQYDPASSTLQPTLSFAPTNGAAPVSANLDLSSVTQLSTPGVYSVLSRSQDGLPPGSLQNFSVGQDGVITGVFSNGMSDVLGRLALANFTNDQGLERGDGGVLHETVASGPSSIQPASQGTGTTITSGALESSNVDIGREFTRMIVAQRSFEANARMVTTMDQILSDLTRLRG